MRIALITNRGSIFGKKIANGLISRGIMPDGIIVVEQPFKYYWRLFCSVQKKVGIIDAVYFSIKRLISEFQENRKYRSGQQHFINSYNDLSAHVYYVKGTNAEMTVDALKSISPDLLLLGQAGIVNRAILNIPNIGTLNAHPAILPLYRGVDCHLWAIYNNDFCHIGSSIHWVDEGVDTGDIIGTAAYEFKGDETPDILGKNLNDRSVTMLVDSVSALCDGVELPRRRQNEEEGTQYFKMPLKTEWYVKRKLNAFLRSHGK